MQLEATSTTHKATLGTAIVPSGVMTLGALLRGVPGVNPSHRQSAFLCLVRDERKELGERPAMHTAFGCSLAFGLHALADVSEVFEDQCPARSSRLDKLSGQNVVAVAPKASLLASEMSQVTFGTLAPTGLQAAFEPEVTAFGGFPRLLTQKLVCGSHCWLCQTQVNTNDLIGLRDCWGFDRDNDMQPPLPMTMLDQVSGIYSTPSIADGVMRHCKRDRQPPSHGRKAHGLGGPGQRIGVQVIAGRARNGARTRDLASNLLESKGRLQSFCCFDTGLNEQVRHQARAGRFFGVVGRVVQLDAVLFVMRPSVGTDIVKRSRKLLRGLGQRLRLF